MNSLEIAFQSGFQKEAKEEIVPQEEKVNIPTMAAGSTAAGAGLGMLGEAITGAGRHLPPVQSGFQKESSISGLKRGVKNFYDLVSGVKSSQANRLVNKAKGIDIFRNKVNKIEDEISDIARKSNEVIEKQRSGAMDFEDAQAKLDELSDAEKSLRQNKEDLLSEYGSPGLDRESKMEDLRSRTNMQASLARSALGSVGLGGAYGTYKLLQDTEEDSQGGSQ